MKTYTVTYANTDDVGLQDTHLMQGQPDNPKGDFANNQFSSSKLPLVKFTVPAYIGPQYIITAGTLSLYWLTLAAGTGCSVERCVMDWNVDFATWNSYDNGQAWPGVSGCLDDVNWDNAHATRKVVPAFGSVYTDFDITGWVQDAIAYRGNVVNVGLRALAAPGSFTWRSSNYSEASSEDWGPMITISYHHRGGGRNVRATPYTVRRRP